MTVNPEFQMNRSGRAGVESSDDPPTSADRIIGADLTVGVRCLRTWRAVYLLVVGVFVLWVTLLAILSRAFQ